MRRNRHLRRGVYLLPTLFTVGNLLCGFASIILAAQGAFFQSAGLIVLAAVLDGLDGRLARLTGTTSEFGLQFDSLADVVSFGAAPAMFVHRWALGAAGEAGWLAAFLFLVSAAMRLARFNIQSARADKRYFAGLPAPAAAAALASAGIVFPVAPPGAASAGLIGVGTVALGFLMLSRLRYRSFKEFDLRNRRSYIFVLPVAAAVVAIAVQPRVSLLLLAWLYVVSAPAWYLVTLLRRIVAPGVRTPDTIEVADERATR